MSTEDATTQGTDPVVIQATLALGIRVSVAAEGGLLHVTSSALGSMWCQPKDLLPWILSCADYFGRNDEDLVVELQRLCSPGQSRDWYNFGRGARRLEVSRSAIGLCLAAVRRRRTL